MANQPFPKGITTTECTSVFWRKKAKTPQELMAAGDFKGAIKAFREQLKEKREPDPTLMMQLANACLKANKPLEAKQVFMEVGTYFGDRGFFNKSVAAFKKALNITPDDTEILERLSSYNDKVPKFMIDGSILAKLKRDAASHNTGEHAAMILEEAAAEQTALDSVEAQEDASHDTPSGVAEAFASVDDSGPSLNIDDTQPHGDVEASLISPNTDEHDRQHVIEAAKSRYQNQEEGFEEILDLDDLADEDEPATANDGFFMNFGEAQDVLADMPAAPPPPAAPQRPATPNPALSQRSVPPPPARSAAQASTPLKGEQGQPLTRGGMVFKTQDQPKQAEKTALGGSFDSVDDALDSIFSGGGGDYDLFGLDDSEMNLAPVHGHEPTELTLADASPEENAKHWPLFRTMPPDVFMAFVVALDTRDYEIGDIIVREGDPGDEMYLVAEGEVDIVVTIGGHPTVVASLGEGDFFGEASLISGAPRNATVRTRLPVSCLLLKRSDLDKLVIDYPSVMESIESIYYTRIQENASRKGEAGT